MTARKSRKPMAFAGEHSDSSIVKMESRIAGLKARVAELSSQVAELTSSQVTLHRQVGRGSERLIRDLGWSVEEAAMTYYGLRSFEEDWDAPGMDAYDQP